MHRVFLFSYKSRKRIHFRVKSIEREIVLDQLIRDGKDSFLFSYKFQERIHFRVDSIERKIVLDEF